MNQSLISLIQDAAAKHHLPFLLVRAIVKVESGGDAAAMRREEKFFQRYVEDRGYAVILPCTRDTEEHLRGYSFGLMQIMGQTARELGFRETFLGGLLTPEVGLEWGCRYLKSQLDRYHGDLEQAVAAYNLGTARRDETGAFKNQAYVNKIRAAGGFGGVA